MALRRAELPNADENGEMFVLKLRPIVENPTRKTVISIIINVARVIKRQTDVVSALYVAAENVRFRTFRKRVFTAPGKMRAARRAPCGCASGMTVNGFFLGAYGRGNERRTSINKFFCCTRSKTVLYLKCGNTDGTEAGLI